jgi:hypothetical protein
LDAEYGQRQGIKFKQKQGTARDADQIKHKKRWT